MSYNNLLKGRVSLTGQIYLVTTVTHKRKSLFDNFDCARLLVSEMRLLHETHTLQSLAWVIMPNHLHWLIALGEGSTLSAAIKQLKGRSAKLINNYLHKNGSIWQHGYHEHALRAEEDIIDIARYIVANPLRANLVTRLAGYPHWDAEWI